MLFKPILTHARFVQLHFTRSISNVGTFVMVLNAASIASRIGSLQTAPERRITTRSRRSLHASARNEHRQAQVSGAAFCLVTPPTADRAIACSDKGKVLATGEPSPCNTLSQQQTDIISLHYGNNLLKLIHQTFTIFRCRCSSYFASLSFSVG